MNNKVYISGRITGNDQFVRQFADAAMEVKSHDFAYNHTPPGYVKRHNRIMRFRAVNPVDFTLAGYHLNYYPWNTAMFVCIIHLLGCSHIYMMDGWRQSRGATIEWKWAKFFHKHIIYQEPKPCMTGRR